MSSMSSVILLKLDGLVEATVSKRPSYYVKSPYVADISLSNHTITALAHTPSLGCCGLCEKGSTVLISEIVSSNTKTSIPRNKAGLKCEYTIWLSLINDTQIVGINPRLAEMLVDSAIKLNCIKALNNVRNYCREVSIKMDNFVDSRFDFAGIDENGTHFIMEVKNVPLADFEDVSKKDMYKYDFTDRDNNSKVAYFPDGYRKASKDTVSPRALKHITELAKMKKTFGHRIRCIMCYVIQRTDVNRFQPSVIDPEYRQAFKEAQMSGVEMVTMVVQWNKQGEAYFVRDDLPICDVN